jgi:hypothetical protein
MDIRALLRRLAFCSALLLAAKMATFGHATIVPVGLTITKPGVQPGFVSQRHYFPRRKGA